MKTERAKNMSIETEVSGDAEIIKGRLLTLREDAKRNGLVKEEAETIAPGKAKMESNRNNGG